MPAILYDNRQGITTAINRGVRPWPLLSSPFVILSAARTPLLGRFMGELSPSAPTSLAPRDRRGDGEGQTGAGQIDEVLMGNAAGRTTIKR